MNRKQAIDFLINNPVKYAHMLGFTKLKQFHNDWIKKMIKSKDDKTLEASRGSYKTTCVSIALALIIILLPNKRTMFMRKTDSDVKEVIKQVQKILQDPHTLYFVQVIYGVNLKLTVQSATEISTNLTTDIKGTSQLVGMGIGASLTGKHFDYIFTDDIINIQDRISKAERDRTRIIYQELQNIKNRGGRIFNTLTPWHKDSAESLMPNVEKWDCYRKEIKEVISDEELAEIKAKMLPSLFSANYELRYVASEDVIFQTLDASHFGLSLSLVEQGLMHVDSGFYGEDYTAMTVCKKHDGKYYVLLKMWRKHVEECYPDIINTYRRLMSGKCYMETNADKGMVARDLRQAGMKMVTYAEKMNKYVKIVTYLKSIWNDVYFVEGTDMDAVQQIYDYNDAAEHDDAPDSLASMARILYNKRETGDSAAYSMFL